MLKVVDSPDSAALKSFADYIFGCAGAKSIEDFSSVLIATHEKGENMAACIQDEAMNSEEFKALAGHSMWKKLGAEVFGCAEPDIVVAFPHLRIDLPSRFKADEKKISLPWHQEAGYYLEKGNCSPDSVVMSTYLHDCSTDQGALVVALQTEKELLRHDRKFMDPDNRRFMRVEAAEPDGSCSMETRFGKTVILDFLRRHRSGVNHSDIVRLTFLVRVGTGADIENYRKESVAGVSVRGNRWSRAN